MKRAFAVTHTRKMLYCYIPPHADFGKNTETLVKMIGYASKQQQQPLVIYSPDPQLATRMITIAFAVIRRDALRGSTIVCAVGRENESYIRSAVEATGAKLYVQPLP
jgi:hypothetical protein